MKRGAKCKAPNIYDNLLHYIIHDIARARVMRGSVLKIVKETVTRIIGSERAPKLKKWAREFAQADIWEMLSDEDDLAIAIQCVTVMEDRTLVLRWIDGRSHECHLPKYSPRRGMIDDGKE